jgi:hypothetical protein
MQVLQQTVVADCRAIQQQQMVGNHRNSSVFGTGEGLEEQVHETVPLMTNAQNRVTHTSRPMYGST